MVQNIVHVVENVSSSSLNPHYKTSGSLHTCPLWGPSLKNEALLLKMNPWIATVAESEQWAPETSLEDLPWSPQLFGSAGRGQTWGDVCSGLSLIRQQKQQKWSHWTPEVYLTLILISHPWNPLNNLINEMIYLYVLIAHLRITAGE